MLYTAAIDDSADRRRERVVISAAVVGDATRWSHLDKRWRARLEIDGIAYFKSSQCKSRSRQFHKFRDESRYPPPSGEKLAAKVQLDLDAIIRESNLMCIGAIVPMEIYNRVKQDPEIVDKAGTDPYEWAVQAVWGECAMGMRELGRNNIVQFIHDDGNNFPILTSLYLKFKKNPPHRKYSKLMAGFTARNDKADTSIQAADVAASVIYRYAEDWAADPTNDNLKRLRGSMYKIVTWNEEAARRAITT
jgi:hypothetical protein